MAVRGDRLGWAAVLGAVLWAAPLSAQSVRRFAGEVGVEPPPERLLPTEPGTALTGVATTADEVIEQMARAAGVIFAGQVTAVRGPAGNSGAAANVVEVDFRVDEAVKGPTAGSVYTLREWAGLWNAVGGGYRAGQRLLVFLYAPDARGMSSPVRGLDGAVPLRGGGVAPGPDDAGSAAADWMVDLRWVQTQVLKTYPSAAPPVGGGPVFPRPIRPEPVYPQPLHPLAASSRPDSSEIIGAVGPEDEDAGDVAEFGHLPVWRAPISFPAPQPPNQTQSLAQVIALCREAMRGSDGLR